MDDIWLETYLDELARELRARGMSQSRILDETRSYLLESAERGQQAGLSHTEATRQALDRFGPAHTVAAQFAANSGRTMQKVLFASALTLGLLLAYVDTRPTWDDTGISVLAILLGCGLLGMLGPRRPWLWALMVGMWIPIVNIVLTHNYGSLLALPFAFAGAYAGMAVRKQMMPA